MRIDLSNSRSQPGSRHSEQGMAVIVIIIILSILLIYIGGNLRTLHLMRKDLKQIEQQQVSRFNTSHLPTNAVAKTNDTGFAPSVR